MEVLLSIAFFGVLMAMSVPVIESLQQKNTAVLAANIVEQQVRRAQILARNGAEDSDWGVKVQSGSVVLFSGSSYAARNTDYDESYAVSSGVAFSSSPEIVFSKFTGQTASQVSLSVTDTRSQGVDLVIEQNGVVNR